MEGGNFNYKPQPCWQLKKPYLIIDKNGRTVL